MFIGRAMNAIMWPSEPEAPYDSWQAVKKKFAKNHSTVRSEINHSQLFFLVSFKGTLIQWTCKGPISKVCFCLFYLNFAYFSHKRIFYIAGYARTDWMVHHWALQTCPSNWNASQDWWIKDTPDGNSVLSHSRWKRRSK